MTDYSRLLICPGAQKAGTTWLHHVLKQHPQFWMPPQKELDYLFDFLPSRKKYSEKMIPRIARARPGSPLRAWLELFLQDWRLSRYPALFDFAEGRFSADVSPNYSRMSLEEIRDAAKIVPNARIAILLRDPVERAWSHARNTSKTWGVTEPALLIDRMTKFAHSKMCDSMSDYPRLLADWKAQFGREQVLVSFYDDLVLNPRQFIDRILWFIGAPEFPRNASDVLAIHPNVGIDVAMPGEIRRSLAAHYRPMVAKLRDFVDTESMPAWLANPL